VSALLLGCGSTDERNAQDTGDTGEPDRATEPAAEDGSSGSAGGSETDGDDAADDGTVPPPPVDEEPCALPTTIHRTLLIVVDGLHPGYVTPEIAPNLHALGEQGVFGNVHTAAYPTYTRANSPTISTGSYPGRHGVIHNDMWVPEASSEPFSTGGAAALRALDEATNGQLLTVPSLGELLEDEGRVLFVTGSAGSGTSFMQNHRGTGKGIWTAGGFFVPSSAQDEAVEALGPPPSDNSARTVWGVDAYLHHALGADPPDVTTIWVNEPDSAGHAHGVGHDDTRAAVASFDTQLGRILDAHADHGLTDQVNVLVTTDHGFSTSTGGFSVANILSAAGVSGGFMVLRNMVYMLEDDPAKMTAIVRALQQHPNVGNIYTRPSAPGQGSVSGTLSTEVVRWNHDRSADIIVSPVWTHATNAHGFAGTTAFGGTATHGSDSPYDLQIRLVAAGPDFKQGLQSEIPTGNVDMAPTILHLQGVEPPASMDGRVLCELLQGGPDPDEIHVHAMTHKVSANASGVHYEAELDTLQVGSTVYVREARTQRN
jgi:predicted AlkP superfamily pyrophosphatase or phosphodiesterase